MSVFCGYTCTWSNGILLIWEGDEIVMAEMSTSPGIFSFLCDPGGLGKFHFESLSVYIIIGRPIRDVGRRRICE